MERSLEQELYFLIARFLAAGPCHNASRSLLSDLAQNPDLLPARYDWCGNAHPQTLLELTKRYPEVADNHLQSLLYRLSFHANTLLPPPAPNVTSLIGYANSSLLREYSVQHQRPYSGGPSLLVDKIAVGKWSSNMNLAQAIRAREIAPSLMKKEYPPSFVSKSYQELVTVWGHRFQVYCLAFDRTGLRFITGSDDYLVKVWCARTGYLIYTLRGHSLEITDLAVNEENTLLATASMDGIVRVWNLRTYAPVAVLVGNLQAQQKGFTTVCFSPSPKPDTRYLLATNQDGYTRLWRWDQAALTFNTTPIVLDCKFKRTDSVNCSSFNHSGTQFAVSGEDGLVRVFSAVTTAKLDLSNLTIDRLERKLKRGTGSGSEVEGKGRKKTREKRIETVSGRPQEHTMNGPQEIAILEGHNGPVNCLAYSHDGQKILSGSEDGTARIWLLKSWTSICLDIKSEEDQPDPNITTARNILPSNARSLPANADGISESWQNSTQLTTEGTSNATTSNTMTTDETANIAPSYESILPSAVFSSTIFNAASENSTVSHPQHPLHVIDGHSFINNIDQTESNLSISEHLPNASNPMDLTPLDISMSNGSDTLEPMILPPNEVLGIIEQPQKKPDPKVCMIAWSLDDQLAIITTSLGEVKIFDTTTGQLRKVLRGHTDETFTVDIHPFNKRIVMTAGYDGRIIIWDIETFEMLRCDHYDGRMWLDGHFSADGLMYAVTDSDGKCSLFGVGQSLDLYEEARSWAQRGQQFWSDYMPVRYDENWNFVDEQAQIAPHLMDRSPILDWGGLEYETKKPRNYGFDMPIFLINGFFEAEEEKRLIWYEEEADQISAEYMATVPRIDRNKIYKKRREEFIIRDYEEVDPLTMDVPIVPLPQDEKDDDYELGLQESDEDDDDVDDEFLADEFNDEPLHGRSFVEDDNGDGEYIDGRNRTPRRLRRTNKRRAPQNSGSNKKRRKLMRANGLENDTEYGSSPTRMGRYRRAATKVNYEDSSFESEESESQDGSLSPSNVAGSSSAANLPGKKGRSQSKTAQISSASEPAINLKDWLPSEWISVKEPRLSPYHPQIEDIVVYFHQGYQHYWEKTQYRDNFSVASAPSNLSEAMLYCRITQVDWLLSTKPIKPPSFCRLKLEILNMQNFDDAQMGGDPQWLFTGRFITIDYCDESDESIAEFIILWSRFITGIRQNLKVGDQVMALYGDDESYPGTIEAQIGMADWSHQASWNPWQCFRIVWDEKGDPENMSPWELVRKNTDHKQLYVETKSVPPNTRQRIDDVLKFFETLPEFEIFVNPVDYFEVPDYLKIIPYPMCIKVVHERLLNNFYRCSEAVMYDFKLITTNAHKFNRPKSKIYNSATILAKNFKRLVSDATVDLELYPKRRQHSEEDSSQDEYVADVDQKDEEEDEIEMEDASQSSHEEFDDNSSPEDDTIKQKGYRHPGIKRTTKISRSVEDLNAYSDGHSSNSRPTRTKRRVLDSDEE